MTVRLSDPRPAYCSACHNSTPSGRYVDFDAAFDAGAFIGRGDQVLVEGSADLHMGAACGLVGYGRPGGWAVAGMCWRWASRGGKGRWGAANVADAGDGVPIEGM